MVRVNLELYQDLGLRLWGGLEQVLSERFEPTVAVTRGETIGPRDTAITIANPVVHEKPEDFAVTVISLVVM